MSLPASFEIGGRPVGPGEPVYVIAEAGSNHNRDLEIATRLVDVAAEAGADAVKFQTYSGSRIYSTKTPSFGTVAGTGKSPAELLEEISLPREWQAKLAEHARERGIHFFSSPFDHEAVAELEALEVPAMKIASPEIVDLPLIRRAAEAGRPLLISTGMSSLEDVSEALNAATEGGAVAVALLQCTTLYPAPPGLANLRAMETLRAEFGVPVGFSDHTTGTAVAIAAAALGATVIEKHFTLDRTMDGPDHSFAIEPREFTEMVAGVRAATEALGDGAKTGPVPEEAENYRFARRSLIATRDLPEGTELDREMLTVKRPGFGIAPKHLEAVLGRPLTAAVEEDDVLTWELVEGPPPSDDQPDLRRS